MSNQKKIDKTRIYKQSGFSLLGLLFTATLVVLVAVPTIRTVPAINEYRSLLNIVNRLASEGGGSPLEIRAAFDRYKAIEYGIESIGSQDLTISNENDKFVVGFAYDKKIPLAGPVSLLIEFKGQSK